MKSATVARIGFMSLASAMLLYTYAGEACTTFGLKQGDEVRMGKSYDWHQEQGYLMVNKRNVAKTSMALASGDRSHAWTSRYGSVTLNQYGREFPNSGINEEGLAVEVMVLGSSDYPPASAVPSLNETQWVQYMLDMAADVGEMIRLADDVRISKVMVPLHYLACDATGACAGFEYLNGDLKVWHADEMPVPAFANNTYPESMQNLQRYTGFGGTMPLPRGSMGSLSRFVNIADHIRTQRQGAADLTTYAFDGLAKVASSGTMWRVVYDLNGRRVHFSTLSASSRKVVNAANLDYSCAAPVQMLDLVQSQSGDVTSRLSNYDPGKNTALIERSFRGSGMPRRVIDLAIGFPATTVCKETSNEEEAATH